MRLQCMEAYFKRIQVSLFMCARMLPPYAYELTCRTHDHTYTRMQDRVNIFSYITYATGYIITYA